MPLSCQEGQVASVDFVLLLLERSVGGDGSANTSPPSVLGGEGCLCSSGESAPTSGTLQQGSDGLAGWDDNHSLNGGLPLRLLGS